jgi:glycosidase
MTADEGGERHVAPEAVRTHRPYEPPTWAEDAVIYEIYVRTFAGEIKGNTFDAIADRLAYIDSLGVDCIWLTPVLEKDHAPHGYNVTDFFSIAEDLGTREDFERFIDAAHDRDIKVLFDLVCNHSARVHPYFQSAVGDTDSEYRDWYEWRSETEPETYFDWEYIANFDFDHLPVRRHLLDAVDTWAPLVDGFRCDMAWAVPDAFWREVHDRVKDVDPEFLLLDETIPYIPDFQAGLFDMHFDSTTYAALRRVGDGAPAEQLIEAVDERTEIGFPDYAGFMLYAENHDEARYLADYGRDAAEAGLGALFTLPGTPMVYAGQEFGQLGKRDDLAWEHADETLRDHVRSLAAVRHEVPALAAGAALARVDYEVRAGDPDRVVAYARNPPSGERVVVALNFGTEPATLGIDAVTDATDRVSGTVRADEEGLVVESVAVFPAAGPFEDE